jgi:hypothetical protein
MFASVLLSYCALHLQISQTVQLATNKFSPLFSDAPNIAFIVVFRLRSEKTFTDHVC